MYGLCRLDEKVKWKKWNSLQIWNEQAESTPWIQQKGCVIFGGGESNFLALPLVWLWIVGSMTCFLEGANKHYKCKSPV